MNVMIVDDSEVDLELMSVIVKMVGAQPHIYQTASQAMRSFNTRPHFFHAAILDILIPDDLDGLALADVIRQHGEIPIVFHTAHNVRENPDIETRVNAFGGHVLGKPFDKKEALDLLGRLFAGP